ncbi:alpha/beta hydrolase [Neorhodopirellula pilleata]|uniref:Phospholipase YtpA n=1 Tax=Neorhodopirellula pilleata TaxID=2714738 RepID=A0A5C6A591_9BACT|nr:alpha/beta hydrolase [Neorhodopirellula pilleata]TWT95104.1 Phospholipase YtpA [Neorhodopirellula pilleata]
MTTQDQTLETPDGRSLFLRCEGDPSAALAFVVVHGLGEHSGCYDDFIERMTARGRGVLIYDQHGHGQSPGRRGDAPDFETLVNDIAVALEFAAKHFAQAEIVLLGHSMGGNLVLNHLLDRDHEYVRRAVVTNPMILPPDPPTRPQAFAAWLTGKLIPRLRFSASIEPTQLTQDPEMLRELADDDLMHEKLAVGIGSQLINQGLWLIDHADKLNIDLLVLTGSDDELCDTESTEQFVEKAGSGCRHIEFAGLRHSLLVESERDQVYRAIEDWLQSM